MPEVIRRCEEALKRNPEDDEAFDDDPRMTPKGREWAKQGGNPVLHVTRDQNGVQRGVYDIVLLRN